MSVAKSYENYPIEKGPYERDKKQYVQIRKTCCTKKSCKKCAGQGYYLKEVRWYEEKGNVTFDARVGFGFFEKGYITLLKNKKEILENYFHELNPGSGRYNTLFQWYISSDKNIPEDLPENTELIKLNWEQVSDNDAIKDYKEITKIVNSLLYAV